MNIKLKLHPSESKNKYKNWLKKIIVSDLV